MTAAMKKRAGRTTLRDLSLPGHSRSGLEPDDSVCVLVLDLTKVRVEKVEISAELRIELAPRLTRLFNDWIFHGISLPSVPAEYKLAAARNHEFCKSH